MFENLNDAETRHYNQLYTEIQLLGGLATFSASTPRVSCSDHSPAYYLFTIIHSSPLYQTQKSRLKDENVIGPILMSGITMLG